MNTPAPNVAVVGAGILGATIAYALSRTEAHVRLIDRLAAPGQGVTARSFGWVNTIIAEPASAEQQRLRRAFDRYARMNERLGGRLFERRLGSLFWTAAEAETRTLARRGAEAGCDTRLVGRNEIQTLAPLLADPPAFAAYSPADFAIETKPAAGLLVDAARAAGAGIRLGCEALGVETAAGRVTGVRLADGVLQADHVVVAAGAATSTLLWDFAPDLGVVASPAALITIDAASPALDVILCGPDLEIRRRDNATLVAAEDVPENADTEELDRIGRETLRAVRRLMPNVRDPRIRSIEIGARPITLTDTPLVGRIKAAPQVLVAVAHPGVILAPAIAETIVDMIFNREPETEITPMLIGR